MANELFPPLESTVNGVKKAAILTRGDTATLEIDFEDEETCEPADISMYNTANGGQLLWSILRTIEEKDTPIANGTGTVLDDGVTPALAGKAEIEINLQSVDDGEIDHMRNYVFEMALEDSGSNQNTIGPFRVPIKQDGN